ncbi:MAG: hypothetical protein A2504_01810 [Bdellovibrionales bacterium RIFOXYD12_FULL_39_22]|nr:MAG: hypothetical protein A2385_04335 [Bdellovibrionales bacterium RIFOXYB1_FULL_39_21]OFZ42358.1 MAG: hypothetical protein A2485_15160 [Bdellovibrionales bacterium RIFOXYC12_FULL_39_17]OFZ46341.1 MAG: hypothetical protein A2404_13855 [Bdellovibrionales bacterium RIFOXYC1_FULL_39_130]OFZ73120.1 MAG: hypothetical protein A2451_06695 [Bdellovibrionales bacterium RIFOXYC2_FULL_39_8]OFZ75234.1 MAG: hypothetical protein A2560_15910 [Bdellovibrionales bacterium RIFOXYD1_FULL_39_84]OFZ93228.1 MAG:
MIDKKNPLFYSTEDLILHYFGIKMLKDDVRSAEDRLRPLLLEYGCNEVKELFLLANDKPESGILLRIADRVVTSYSYFFREREHFDFLRQELLPDIIIKLANRRSNDIRIWSAACSTGEEPYSIEIVAKDFFADYAHRWVAGVLATDISGQVLEYAKAGIYEMDRLIYFPESSLPDYFNKQTDGRYAVREEIKKNITFRLFNLRSEQYPFKSPFHIVFLRNVLMYFDKRMADYVITSVHKALIDGGYLFVSKMDNLSAYHDLFDFVMPGVYHKRR